MLSIRYIVWLIFRYVATFDMSFDRYVLRYIGSAISILVDDCIAIHRKFGDDDLTLTMVTRGRAGVELNR